MLSIKKQLCAYKACGQTNRNGEMKKNVTSHHFLCEFGSIVVTRSTAMLMLLDQPHMCACSGDRKKLNIQFAHRRRIATAPYESSIIVTVHIEREKSCYLCKFHITEYNADDDEKPI